MVISQGQEYMSHTEGGKIFSLGVIYIKGQDNGQSSGM